MRKIKEYSDKFRSWLLRKLDSDKMPWWLSGLSFAESSFFPVPPDIFLIPMVAREPNKWLRLALLTVVSSVLGGVVAYFIGQFFFSLLGQPIIDAYHLQDELYKVGEMFEQNAFWAIFTAAFTPIPYKIFTIAAGFFKINFITFVIASIVGRGIRFFVIAYIMKVFGPALGKLVFKYFNITTIVIAIIAIAYIATKFIS